MEYLHKAYISNLNPVCREGGFFSLQPGQVWAYQEHCAAIHKFYFITKGSCRITMEGKTYFAKSGDWFFIPAGMRHSYSHLPDTPFEKHWIHFDLYPDDSLPRLLQLPHLVNVSTGGKMAGLFSELTKANACTSLSGRLRAKIALLSLIAGYLEAAKVDDLPVLSKEDERINQVLTYIHQNLSQALCNNDLARLCHMHPNHFIRFFSRKTGQPPASYVTQCRMDLARQLLTQTDLPVGLVAEQVGLPEQSHFSRLFRRYCSATPTQYRNRHK